MSTGEPIHVLLVEDSPTDVLLAQDALEAGRKFEVVVAGRLGTALELLAQRRFDVVLLDLGLPDSQGLDTLQKLHEGNPRVPVVVMTAKDDEELAVRAVHTGAQDYLVKSHVRESGLTQAIRYAIERNRVGEELRERVVLASLSADVGQALSRSATLRAMLKYCAESLVRNLGAAFARFWTLDGRDNVLELQASAGMYTHLDGPHSRIPVGKFKIGLIAEEKRPHLTNAVLTDPASATPSGPSGKAWSPSPGIRC